MKQEIQAKLDQVFEKKRQVEVAAAQAKSAQEQREEDAVAKFKVVKEALIKPTMREFVNYLASKDCEATISEREERFTRPPSTPQLQEASIHLQISPQASGTNGYSAHTGQLPYFQVRLEKSKSKVFFFESTIWGSKGGHAGSCGEVDLDLLDQKTLEAAITKTIASVFG
jgi:hypothetical protein